MEVCGGWKDFGVKATLDYPVLLILMKADKAPTNCFYLMGEGHDR